MEQSSCKSSSAWHGPIPPSRPPLTDSSSFPTRVPGTSCSPRRISMGEETKAQEIAEGSATTKKIEKKKEPKWRHTFSVFSGHPPVLLANSFFRRRPSPSYPPVPDSPFRTLRAPASPSLSFLRVFSRDPHPRAIDSFISLLLLYSRSSPCTPGLSISSPTVLQYLKE